MTDNDLLQSVLGVLGDIQDRASRDELGDEIRGLLATFDSELRDELDAETDLAEELDA